MKVWLAALCAFSAAAVSGCASLEPTWPTKDNLVAFDKGASGVLIMATEGEVGCDTSHVSMLNADTKADASFFTGPSGAAAAVVAPGKYRIYYFNCINDQYEALPNVGMWFMPMEVKPGEVVYAGTLRAEAVNVKREMPMLTQVLNLGLAGNSITDSFVVYEYKDHTNEVREQVRAKNPVLADRMITRIPQQLLSRKAFIDAYTNAYAPGPDGKLPTQEQVDARFKTEVRKAVDQSLAEFVAKSLAEIKEARDAREGDAGAPKPLIEIRPPPPAPVAVPAPAPPKP